MSKIDEKRLEEIAERHWGREHEGHWSPLVHFQDAVNEAFRLGWEERNGTVPHLEFTYAGTEAVQGHGLGALSKMDGEIACARLGGACRSFAGEEGAGMASEVTGPEVFELNYDLAALVRDLLLLHGPLPPTHEQLLKDLNAWLSRQGGRDG